MTLPDILVILVILLIVGGAAAYVIHAKKSGKRCIGCPDSCSCSASKKKGGESGCGSCGGACHCHEDQQ